MRIEFLSSGLIDQMIEVVKTLPALTEEGRSSALDESPTEYWSNCRYCGGILRWDGHGDRETGHRKHCVYALVLKIRKEMAR